MPRTLVLVLVLALALAAQGCSFLTFGVPNKRPRVCTIAPPVIDTVVAVPTIAVPAVLAVMANSSDGATAMGGGTAFVFIGLPMLAVGIPYAVSAIYGYRANGRCQRFKS